MKAINRRSVLQCSKAAIGSSIAALSLPPRAYPQYFGKSYIEQTVAPQNMNDVLRWLDIMLSAVRDHGLTPPEASRVFGIGMMAGFIAMNGIGGRYTDTMGFGRGPMNSDMMAAYHVAIEIALTTAMQRSFRGFRNRMLSKIPNGEAKSRGIRWGKHIGQKIAAQRARDGSENTKSNFYRDDMQKRTHILAWEPTLPVYVSGNGPRVNPFSRPLLPSWGMVDPLGVKSIKKYRAERFPNPRSSLFWNDVKLIQEIGGTNSRHRTDDQTHTAFFWEDGPPGATPSGHFIIICAQLMQGRVSTYEMARAMALIGMASADAGIAAWDSKFAYDIVRPETVIRQRAHIIPGFQNAGMKQDPRWSSLILTPPFPSYTSGHSTFGAAGARMIQLMMGTDRIKFTLKPVDLAWWPEQLVGTSRQYFSIWETAVENGLSRVFGGVHWTFDHDQGMRAGREISDEIFAHHFRPVTS